MQNRFATPTGKRLFNSQRKIACRWVMALAVALHCLLDTATSRQLQAQNQPNIVYIFVDDLSSGMVGFTNPNTLIKTPNIDALATSGLQFRQAYANTICSPSRGSLYTGYHNGHAINDRNVISFRGEDIMPGEMIQEAGYATAVYGKWGYGGSTGTHTGTTGVDTLRINPVITNQNTLPTNHGYDDFVGYLNHVQAHRFFIDPLWQSDLTSSNTMSHFSTGNNAGDDVTNTFAGYTDDHHTWEAMSFITLNATMGMPFMIQMHYNSPHPAFDPGEKLTTDFAGNPKAWDQDYQGLGLTVKQRQLGAMITRLDEHVGALVDHLRDPNGDGNQADSIIENTVIMFTSDNGGEPTDTMTSAQWNALGGNHMYGTDYRGGKRDLFEGGVRVPMFAYWPGTILPNQFTDEPIDLADFMPTAADLAGIEAPIGLDGVSYAGLLTGEGMLRRRPHFVWEHHERDGPDPDTRDAEWSVLKDNVKLIHFSDGSEDMYNLNTDPGETQTLNLTTFAALRSERQAIAVAEGVTQAANSYAARHVDWTGGNLGSTVSPANWSNGDTLQEVWVSVIANLQAAPSTIEFDDADFLGIEVTADSATQTIRLNPASELVVRNELRIAEDGRVQLDAAALNCWRWLDVKTGGELTGTGDLAGQLYNWGTVAPGLPSDLPPAIVAGGGNSTPTGVTLFDPAAGGGGEPTENVLLDRVLTSDTIGTSIDSTSTPGARGQSFVVGQTGTTVEISGVTFQADDAQSFVAGDEMTIAIFSGDDFAGADQQNISPAGLAAAPGVSILYQETFQLPANVPSENFLIFGFANSLSIDGGQPMGLMVFTNTNFDQLEGNNNGGGRLLYRQGSAVNEASSRDFRFSILGAATGGGQPITFNETARLALDGDFHHQPSGELRLQVGGTDNSNSADFQFDQLIVDGTMTNAGALVVELLPEYVPTDGDQIVLIESQNLIGDFSSVSILGTPVGFDATIEINNDDVVLTVVDEFLLGDVNQNGVVDFQDIAPFIALLSSGGFLDEADIDRDVIVDFLDIGPFIQILSR